MIIGAYYLTEPSPAAKGEGRVFRHLWEVERAYEAGEPPCTP
jgi:DNA-directed RNA polymerase subunit beta'